MLRVVAARSKRRSPCSCQLCESSAEHSEPNRTLCGPVQKPLCFGHDLLHREQNRGTDRNTAGSMSARTSHATPCLHETAAFPTLPLSHRRKSGMCHPIRNLILAAFRGRAWCIHKRTSDPPIPHRVGGRRPLFIALGACVGRQVTGFGSLALSRDDGGICRHAERRAEDGPGDGTAGPPVRRRKHKRSTACASKRPTTPPHTTPRCSPLSASMLD